MGIFGRTLVSFVSWNFTTSFADIIVYIVLAYQVLVGFPLRILWCPWRLLRFGLMNSIHFCWLTNPCPLTIDCWLLTDSLWPTLLVAFSKVRSASNWSFSNSFWSARPTTIRLRFVSSCNKPNWLCSARPYKSMINESTSSAVSCLRRWNFTRSKDNITSSLLRHISMNRRLWGQMSPVYLHFCYPKNIGTYLLSSPHLFYFIQMQNETARIALSIWSIRKVSRSRILLVAIFGTTLDWSSVLDFHSKILQASLILGLK